MAQRAGQRPFIPLARGQGVGYEGFQRSNERSQAHRGQTVPITPGTGGGASDWGDIGGTLADQTDLQTALDGKQPLDSDLTAIAALTTTAFGRGFLDLVDAAAGRTKLALGTAAQSAVGDFQPVDSDLTAIAALTTTAFGRGFLDLADAAAGRTKLGLGTAALSASGDFQPIDSDLTSIAALTTTAYGRALLTLADAAAFTALGNAFTSALKGLVPASGGGTSNFLRADGTWAAPAGGSGPTRLYKSASTTRNSTATLAADPHLVLALGVGRHHIKTMVAYTSTVAADWQVQLVFTGTSTIPWFRRQSTVTAGLSSGTDNEQTQQATAFPAALTIATSTAGLGLYEAEFVIDVTVAGNYEFRWAQGVSDAGNTVVLRDSYIEYLQIA